MTAADSATVIFCSVDLNQFYALSALYTATLQARSADIHLLCAAFSLDTYRLNVGIPDSV